jgi:hypothetical protein
VISDYGPPVNAHSFGFALGVAAEMEWYGKLEIVSTIGLFFQTDASVEGPTNELQIVSPRPKAFLLPNSGTRENLSKARDDILSGSTTPCVSGFSGWPLDRLIQRPIDIGSCGLLCVPASTQRHECRIRLLV